MIRDPKSQGFLTGTHRPEHFHETTSFSDEIEGFLDGLLWKKGVSLFLIGPPGCGKTSLGLSVMQAAWRREAHMQAYWAESDYLTDVRALWRYEDLTAKITRDDALWAEYVDWEKSMWERKDRPHMFLDGTCRSYTAMQWYEVENLLQYREGKGLATMVAASGQRWDNAPSEIKSMVWRTNLVIEMEGWGDGEPPG